MKDTLEMGMAMWNHLAPAFKEALKEAGMVEHKERAQVWASFLAAASGGMMHDLGKPSALTVLEGVLDATRESPHLQIVPPSTTTRPK